MEKFIKSPLNYVGGKFKLLEQILQQFPSKIDNFVDLFAGGCNVGINITANKIYFNDNLLYLIDLYKTFQNESFEFIINFIEKRIREYNLSLTNEDGYNKLRIVYNNEKNPLDLFTLICYSFNHQIRFNNNHQFNTSFGKDRSSFNDSIKNNLEKFIYKLQNSNVEFCCQSFELFDTTNFGENDLFYCDPPYLITVGSYNDGKRGFKGWTEREEIDLLIFLDKLDEDGVKFALSNVLHHKGLTNDLLNDWLNNNDYKINILDKNYSNASYHLKNRDNNSTVEILVTNY